MAANTFEEWDCIKDCAVEDRQCQRCEEAWNAATAAAEEKFNSAHLTANNDYAAALKGISDYRSSEGDNGGSIDHLKVWLQLRINSCSSKR